MGFPSVPADAASGHVGRHARSSLADDAAEIAAADELLNADLKGGGTAGKDGERRRGPRCLLLPGGDGLRMSGIGVADPCRSPGPLLIARGACHFLTAVHHSVAA